ncbi:MAG TPA: trypsin-like peptidase domain-containing protein [Actinomycetota bacterium]|nr:trypsin-like peptidase domain-containing protein [Actinomycetota bacterium]
MAAALAVVAILVIAGALGAFNSSSTTSSGVPANAKSGLKGGGAAPPKGTAGGLDVRAALRAVEPGVVAITAQGTTGPGTTTNQGTGMVVDNQGNIVTNAHVVTGATEATVQFDGQGASYTATVVAADDNDDVAVIRIQNPPQLTPVPLGQSANVQIGDPVLTISNALGLAPGGLTVSHGIVSGLNRTVDSSDADLPAGTRLIGLLQTSAPVNPGSSGGPLVGPNGKVIGMVTSAAAPGSGETAQNISYAIPIDEVTTLLPNLKKGSVPPARQGFLGVEVTDAPTGGAQVTSVQPGSPAASAGLQSGDIIVGVNGTAVATSGDVSLAVSSLAPGSKVSIRYVRSGSAHTVTVTLAPRPAPTPSG